jgi:hypothetical protein
VVQTTRITKKAAASLLFGLGTFILMADMLIAILRNGDEGGTVFEMGFPGVLGYIGFILWSIGVIILVFHKMERGKRSRNSVRPIFLHGRTSFKCVSCGKSIDCSRIDFQDRKKCSCGKLFDVYEDDRTEDI